MRRVTPEQIDALLPQTQCGLCGYGGCMPYAEALIYNEAPINLCPPGGTDTLNALAALLDEDPRPYQPEMVAKIKPKTQAVIRENECIGCTKCIVVCPVDAIIGSAKQMHSVIAAECTGCELCIPPCPVDCIDVILADKPDENKSATYRQRFLARETRLKQQRAEKEAAKQVYDLQDKRDYIKAALARAQAKKNKINRE